MKRLSDYIEQWRDRYSKSVLVDNSRLYVDTCITQMPFADAMFYNIVDILTDICNDTKFVYRGTNAQVFAAFSAFFDTYGQQVMNLLFDNGFAVIKIDRTSGVFLRLMDISEYTTETHGTRVEVRAIDGSEVYVMRSPTFCAVGKSDRQLLKPYLKYLDNVLNGSNTANERMGVLISVSPESVSGAPTQPTLTKWEKDEFEKKLGGDESEYGILKKQKSVILFPKPMRFQTISLSSIDNKLTERVKMCILAIADRIKVPANQIAIIDSNNSRSLSNGGELREGDKAKYKSFRRFLNSTFWIMARDLGLGDIDYIISGEPQENTL